MARRTFLKCVATAPLAAASLSRAFDTGETKALEDNNVEQNSGEWRFRIMDVDVTVSMSFEGSEGAFEDRGQGVWSNRAVKVEFKQEGLSDGESVLRIGMASETGSDFALRNLTVVAHAPSARVHRHYAATSPERNRVAYASYIWHLEDAALSCNSSPFVQGYDRYGVNAFLMGFADQVRDSRISHESTHTKGQWGLKHTEFSLSKPARWGTIRAKRHEEAVYFSRARVHQMKAISMYRDFVDKESGFVPCHVPDKALEPVWCTFYAFMGGRLNLDRTMRNAEIARGLGIKTILIDAGWFDPTDVDRKRFPLGVMRARGERFPDLRATIEQLKEIGLNTVLWTAPLFWRSFPGNDLADRLRVRTPNGKVQRYLCPQVKEVTEITGDLVADAMKEYRPAGLKIDFIDIGPAECAADHKHNYDTVGEGMDRVLSNIHSKITAADAEALIEFRENYANIRNRRYANCYRANDAPFDADQIRRAMAMMKPYAPPIPIHADYIYWPPDEELHTKAVAMAGIVFGMVPTVSIDFIEATQDELRLIEAWLHFYHGHKKSLALGEYEALAFDPHYSAGRIGDGEKNFFGLFSVVQPGVLPLSGRGVKSIFVINGTSREKLLTTLEGAEGKYRLVRFNRFLEPAGETEVEAGSGRLRLECDVEIGGLVSLERTG